MRIVRPHLYSSTKTGYAVYLTSGRYEHSWFYTEYMRHDTWIGVDRGTYQQVYVKRRDALVASLDNIYYYQARINPVVASLEVGLVRTRENVVAVLYDHSVYVV